MSSNNIEENNNEAKKELCWTCSFLYKQDNFFVCGKDIDVVLEPIEVAVSDCKYFREGRNKIHGTARDMWKLLVAIDKPVALHSLSTKMVGALGILKKYNLVKVEEGMVMSAHSTGKGRAWVAEKFVICL